MSIPFENWLEELTNRLPVLNVSSSIAACCYDLGSFHGDPADRIVVATALVHGLTVVTRDEKIRAYRKVETLWN